jgi:hypothetical protein
MASYSVEGSLVLEKSKLAGLSNYSTWKFHVSSLVQRDELINLVEPNFDGDFKTKKEETVEDLEHRKKKALMAIIGLSVKDEIIPHAYCWDHRSSNYMADIEELIV